jgi:hypothetical protein
MIQKFVNRFMAAESVLREKFAAKHPDAYIDIVKAVVSVIGEKSSYVDAAAYGEPDAPRIHQIDADNYQGTLVFVIAAVGYQPSNYWYVKVYYGSCSGCDTLEGIRDSSDGPVTKEQVDAYMTLALHIVQGFKSMQTEEDAE